MTGPRRGSELALRFYSALILILISLSLTYFSATSFAALLVFFATLMGWEWARVVRKTGVDLIFCVQTVAVASAGGLTLIRYHVSAVAVMMVGTLAAFWLHKTRLRHSDPWWSAAGVYYAGFPVMALISIRQDPDFGLAAVIYLFLIVWSADTGAFFAGRFIGGPKLAPAISPNKTWAGLAGGAGLALMAGIAFGGWFPGASPLGLGVQSIFLALIAQGGDLGESAIKRIFGVKHSSGLIPGHGGVLDRLDGLVFAAIGAGLIVTMIDPARPGRALLLG